MFKEEGWYEMSTPAEREREAMERAGQAVLDLKRRRAAEHDGLLEASRILSGRVGRELSFDSLDGLRKVVEVFRDAAEARPGLAEALQDALLASYEAYRGLVQKKLYAGEGIPRAEWILEAWRVASRFIGSGQWDYSPNALTRREAKAAMEEAESAARRLEAIYGRKHEEFKMVMERNLGELT